MRTVLMLLPLRCDDADESREEAEFSIQVLQHLRTRVTLRPDSAARQQIRTVDAGAGGAIFPHSNDSGWERILANS